MTVRHFEGRKIYLKQRQIDLLLALDQTRHLGQAAELLHMSQPAASKALAQLEDYIGQTLFVRSGTGTYPTVLGSVVIDYAHNLAGAAKRISEELHALQNSHRQSLRIGILPSTSIHITPRLVTALLARNSNLEISIREGLLHELLPQLVRHELDCVIGRTTARIDSNEIETTFLYEDPVALVAGINNDDVLRDGLSMEELLQLPWILPVRDSVLRDRIDEMFYRLGVARPANYIESNAVLTNVMLINENNRISVMPGAIAEYFEKQGQLKVLPIDTKSSIGNVEMMTRRDAVTSQPVALVRDTLRALFP